MRPAGPVRIDEGIDTMTIWRLVPVLALASLSVIGSAATATTANAKMRVFYHEDRQMVRIVWTGRIQKPMARQFRQAIKKWHGRAQDGFQLILNSRGGKVSEGRKVIDILRRLKRTRRLTTAVYPGMTCGSMCIPIFLQGEERSAGTATLWLLHEVSRSDPKTKKLIELNPKKTQNSFRNYFLPAGVPQAWIDMITKKIRGRDVWWTGGQIYKSGSNIITRRLNSTRKRKLYRPSA